MKHFITSIILLLLILSCSSDDDESRSQTPVRNAFITLTIDGEQVFNRQAQTSHPSQEMITAVISTQSIEMNGNTIPANSLLIFGTDTNYQNSGSGKSVYAFVPNIQGIGNYNFTQKMGKFIYMNTQSLSDSYICYVDEPYETEATIHIESIGDVNPEQNGRFVKGMITGLALAGSMSSPDETVAFTLQFNGGLQ